MADDTTTPAPPPAPPPFLAGGGATGALIAAHDWARTPLGPLDRWPSHLRTAAALMLRSPVPMALLWGTSGTVLYNDAYAELIGGRHPALLGATVRDGWPEIADFNDQVRATCLAGGTLSFRDQPRMRHRRGHVEHLLTNLDFSPIVDPNDRPVGVLAIVTETTARREAEQQRLEAEDALRARDELLALSVESLQLATDAAGIGIWDLDLTRDALTWSDRTKAMFGISPGTPCSMADFYAGLHPDDREATSLAFAAALDPARRATYDVEYRTIGKEDGRVRSVAAKGKGLFDAEGRCVRALGTAIDITERKQVESRRAALVELGDRIRDLDDPGELGYAAAELLGRTIGVSRAGYGTIDKRAEIITIERDWNAPGIRSLAGVLHFRDYGSYIDDLNAGRTVVCDDVRLDARTAATADALEAISARSFVNMPVTEAGGMVALLYLNHEDARAWTVAELTFMREVAERTRAASARREAERDLRALNASLERQIEERTAELQRLWRHSRDLSVVVSADGIFRAVNPAWTALLGHDPRDVIGRSLRDFVWREDLTMTEQALQKATDRTLPDDFENRYTHRDGTPRWISWRTSTEGDLVYAYGRDITAEKAQAEALAAAQDALRQAQKMEAVGQLTGGIAHDFNNMLAVIVGSLDLLRRRVGTSDARASRYVDSAADGARRAALLTQRLLAFSRQQPLKPEPVDANALVAGMSDLLRRSLGSAVQLETVLAGGLWRTRADPNQLENALLNLAVNARDAMPDGGRLTIETQNSHLDSRYAGEHLGLAAGQYVMIAVTDTGVGMAPDVIAKAFDPFFTTKAVGKGTGLGLSQVYGFVKQSGGHVKIYSEPGQGTSVKIYLPRLVEAVDEPGAATLAAEIPLGERHEVVLVVEDQATVRQFSVEALGELGYRVLEADGAEAALRLLDAHPEIALMFTDVVMPNVNGARLAEEARRRRPGLRVLFTTGYTRNAVVHNGVLDPGVHLIGKPFTIDELALKVREALEAT